MSEADVIDRVTGARGVAHRRVHGTAPDAEPGPGAAAVTPASRTDPQAPSAKKAAPATTAYATESAKQKATQASTTLRRGTP